MDLKTSEQAHDDMKDMEGSDHKNHGNHNGHESHEEIFRRKFWGSLILSLPVIFFSETVQSWLKYTAPEFPGSEWIIPLFSVIIFVYGGVPFIKMAVPEMHKKKPGMMSLISLAISVALVYSLTTTFFDIGVSFYWELVTLIDLMLLGHWMEKR